MKQTQSDIKRTVKSLMEGKARKRVGRLLWIVALVVCSVREQKFNAIRNFCAKLQNIKLQPIIFYSRYSGILVTQQPLRGANGE